MHLERIGAIKRRSARSAQYDVPAVHSPVWSDADMARLRVLGMRAQLFSSISQIDERPFVVISDPQPPRSASLPPISSMTKCQVGTPVRKTG